MFSEKDYDKGKIRFRNIIYCIYHQLFPIKNYRRMIQFIREYNKNNNHLVGCEIGVAHGANALSMLTLLPIKKLYLVDPYKSYVDDAEHDFSKGEQIAKKRLSRFSKQTNFIKKYSEDAANDIPNDLDFVYIDGNHSYEYVKKDIELYYTKVKKGGVFGGHDFIAHYGVPIAVVEFVKMHNLELRGGDIDWWVIKK